MNDNAEENPCDHVNFVYKLGENGKFYTSGQHDNLLNIQLNIGNPY